MDKEKEIFIVDTNIWLAAIASSDHEGTEFNSDLDRQVRSNQIDSRKVRGKLIDILSTHVLIVPAVVLQEIKAKMKDPKLMSDTNRERAQMLLDALEPRAMKITPTRDEVNRQANAVETLAKKVELVITKLRNLGMEIPINWTEEIERRDQVSKNLRHTLLQYPTIRTWVKIMDYAPRVISNRDSLPESGDTTQRELLKTAIGLRQLNDQSSAPNDPETSSRNKKIGEIETLAEASRPHMIPDFEIYFCAQRTKASTLLSEDGDMNIIAAETAGPKPNIRKTPTGGWKDIKDLANAIRRNQKENKSVINQKRREHELQFP